MPEIRVTPLGESVSEGFSAASGESDRSLHFHSRLPSVRLKERTLVEPFGASASLSLPGPGGRRDVEMIPGPRARYELLRPSFCT